VRWLRGLPPALLAVVACHQIFLARTAHLSPWLGGGFGMFSTTDAWANRHLHAWALRPGIRREIAVPSTLGPLVRRALALPTDTNLRALAADLAEVASAEGEAAETIAVQIWAPRFARETLAPSSVLVRALRVARGQR
jgi:hypothetical protein